jgi:glycosyltransferase involved in cell wall biosynthesis
MKKNIAHLIATNFYGGPEKQIVEHIKRLDTNEYLGNVISFIENGQRNEMLEHASNARLNNFGVPMNGPADIRALWNLTLLLRKEKISILCVHGYKSTIIGWVAARINKIPIIAFSRGYTAENRKVAFYESLDRQVLRHVDGIIAVSEGQKNKLAAFGVHGKRSWVVHNAALLDHESIQHPWEFRQSVFQRLEIPENARLVVTAGRLSPEKGHRFLVDAIGSLKDKLESTFFVFCGDGPCKTDLVNQAASCGIGDICRFAGFRHDIREIFSVMDLFVLPSLTEGLPNVILESFACSKPVVATSVGGTPEIVENGVNGMLVPSKRPDLIAEAILNIFSDPENLKAMGREGLNTVKKHFTFEIQAQKLAKIYKVF